MPLSIDSHRAGEITVLACRGRIVEGEESAALQRRVDAVIAESPYIVLDLRGIEFIDSSGLGLLVRCLIRLESLHGIIRICGASPRIAEAFRMTGLNTLFNVFATETDAIAGFYDLPTGTRGVQPGARILCVDQSPDVLAYVGQLLRQAGYVVVTTTNVSDGLVLLRATRPKMVVVSAAVRGLRGTASGDAFNKEAEAAGVIELPEGFSGQDATAAGRELLDRVRGSVASM